MRVCVGVRVKVEVGGTIVNIRVYVRVGGRGVAGGVVTVDVKIGLVVRVAIRVADVVGVNEGIPGDTIFV